MRKRRRSELVLQSHQNVYIPLRSNFFMVGVRKRFAGTTFRRAELEAHPLGSTIAFNARAYDRIPKTANEVLMRMRVLRALKAGRANPIKEAATKAIEAIRFCEEGHRVNVNAKNIFMGGIGLQDFNDADIARHRANLHSAQRLFPNLSAVINATEKNHLYVVSDPDTLALARNGRIIGRELVGGQDTFKKFLGVTNNVARYATAKGHTVHFPLSTDAMKRESKKSVQIMQVQQTNIAQLVKLFGVEETREAISTEMALLRELFKSGGKASPETVKKLYDFYATRETK
jgi:hypothetical protein